MPPIVLLLFMCFSLHACNARHLGFIDKHSGGKPYHSINQDVGKVLIVSQTSKSSARPVALVQYQEPVELKKAGHTSSGHDIVTLSSGIDMRKMVYMKGLKRQGRILLGSSTTHEMKEDTDSKEDETVEDVGVMDYAQPHRKPPIHNEKAP